MSKRFPLAKWVLPETVNPVARRCIQIDVPDDPAHIAAFRGALLALASAYNWSDDPTHKAREVALVWRDIIDSHQDWGCGVGRDTQLRVDDICTLSWTYDDWVTFDSYDPSSCIMALIDSIVPGMINDAILQGILDGTIQRPGGQPAPGSTPAQNTCQTYHVILPPGSTWHSPFPVSAGYTIEITNAVGGWSIGELAWYCPDGYRYILGQCSESLHTHLLDDPLTSANHMAVIGQIEGGDYFDPLTSVYHVPSGVTDADFTLLANTALTGAPSGNAEFDITICNAEWCYLFDFATMNDGTWNWFNEGQGDRGIFINGQGPTATVISYYGTPLTGLRGSWVPSSVGWQFTGFEITIVVNSLGGGDYRGGIYNGTSSAALIPEGSLELGEHTYIADSGLFPSTMTDIRFYNEQYNYSSPAPYYFKSIKFRGLGACPFGDPNC